MVLIPEAFLHVTLMAELGSDICSFNSNESLLFSNKVGCICR